MVETSASRTTKKSRRQCRDCSGAGDRGGGDGGGGGGGSSGTVGGNGNGGAVGGGGDGGGSSDGGDSSRGSGAESPSPPNLGPPPTPPTIGGAIGLEAYLADQFLRILLNQIDPEQSQQDIHREQAEKKRQHKEMLAERANGRLLTTAKAPAEFEQLRVAQLKSILKQNYVDYDLCKF
jgi:hypothetical protein